MKWAVDGLFGYCTFESVASAVELALTAPIVGAETLWVVEPETFSTMPPAELAHTYYRLFTDEGVAGGGALVAG